MKRRAASSILAILAALVWAPSAVLGAPPNQLQEAAATPQSGTTATIFTLSVRYVSIQGNAADSVVAEVGPVTLALVRVSGTDLDGHWSGTTLLPAGTWSVNFRATAPGPDPSLAGPVLAVLSKSTPAPSYDPVLLPPSEPSEPGGGSPTLAPDELEPLPAASPQPAPPASLAPLAPQVPSPGAAPMTGAGTTPSTGGAVATVAPVATPETGGGVLPGQSSHRAAAATPEPAWLEGDEPATDPTLLLLLLAVVGVTSIALLGTGWLLAVRDRSDDERGGADLPAGRDASLRTAPELTARAAAIAERRARRRRELSGSVDPILASMGLDGEDEPLAPTRGVARGAVPRPRRGRRP